MKKGISEQGFQKLASIYGKKAQDFDVDIDTDDIDSTEELRLWLLNDEGLYLTSFNIAEEALSISNGDVDSATPLVAERLQDLFTSQLPLKTLQKMLPNLPLDAIFENELDHYLADWEYLASVAIDGALDI